MPAASLLRREDPQAQIHWVTRLDFVDFVKSHMAVDQTWGLDKKTGFKGLWRLIKTLRAENYTHIYDAHSNLRSHILKFILRLVNPNLKVTTRSKNRIKRFLLFTLHINLFDKKFVGVKSYLEPLKKWFANFSFSNSIDLNLKTNALTLPAGFLNYIVLAPSAAWELKRWPIDYWKMLIELLPNEKFLLLGGPEDVEMCQQIVGSATARTHILAGRLSWIESCQLISGSKLIVSGDTGLLHAADIMGQPALAIIGPTAFGYPSQKSSQVIETELYCKPCTKDGRGRCRNKTFKKCLIDITPENVSEAVRKMG